MFGDIESEMRISTIAVLVLLLLKGVLSVDWACDNMRCTKLIQGLNRLNNQQICSKLGESIDCVSNFLNTCEDLTEEMKETVRNDVLQMRQDHNDICPVTPEVGDNEATQTDNSEKCDNTRCAEFIYGMNWFDREQMCSKYRETIECTSDFAEECPVLSENLRTSIRDDNVRMREHYDELCPDTSVVLKPQTMLLITLTVLQILFLQLY